MNPDLEVYDVTTQRWRRSVLGLVVGWLAAGLAWAADPGPLAVVYREQAAHAGTLESRGRALASGELLTTSEQGAIVRLANGHVLRLAANSSARLETGPDGEVSVTVLSGRAGLVDDAGELHLAGQRSSFRLAATSADAERMERLLLAADLERRPARPEDPR